MESPASEVLRNKAILSRFRLTISETEVEFWEYSRGFLQHARESTRATPEIHAEERRADNLNAVRNGVRRLVNANVGKYGYEPCFLTFTFKRNEQCIDTAWSDWHAFMRRMRSAYGTLHALTVMEFQKRGAVHFHCIFFNLPPEVEKNERTSRNIAKLWGHGFVDIERVRSAKNVGAYVCKYLNKSSSDKRLLGKKFYSTTRNLFKPREYVGDLAKKKMFDIIEQGRLELLAETQYAYGGAPVVYRNYKITKELCSP